MSNKIVSTEELVKKDTLTNNEINLLVRRANNPKTREATIAAMNEREDAQYITAEQTKKGLDWLNNQRRTPRGVERKNNPFGYREEAALDGFQCFSFAGLYDAGNVNHSWYVPIYEVHGKDGGFQYVIKGGEIEIIG